MKTKVTIKVKPQEDLDALVRLAKFIANEIERLFGGN